MFAFYGYVEKGGDHINKRRCIRFSDDLHHLCFTLNFREGFANVLITFIHYDQDNTISRT